MLDLFKQNHKLTNTYQTEEGKQAKYTAIRISTTYKKKRAIVNLILSLISDISTIMFYIDNEVVKTMKYNAY
jgi:hypothetical protein